MLKFYVVPAGRDMVNCTDRSTTCWSRSRAPPLQRKIQKMKVLPKKLVSPKNRLILSAQKLKTFTFGNREQNQGTTKPQRQLSQYIREAYGHKERKGHPQTA